MNKFNSIINFIHKLQMTQNNICDNTELLNYTETGEDTIHPSNLPMNIIDCVHTKEDLQSFLKTYASNPVVVYVTAKWCGPCKRSFPYIVEKLKERKDILCVKLDYDDDRSAVSYMKVRSVPSLFYMRNNTKENVCFSSSENDIDMLFDIN